jgi:hypothetical protein
MRIEQSIWNYQETCKNILDTIPVTDDAMNKWVLYLEIQAQQQYEEQFRDLKVSNYFKKRIHVNFPVTVVPVCIELYVAINRPCFQVARRH